MTLVARTFKSQALVTGAGSSTGTAIQVGDGAGGFSAAAATSGQIVKGDGSGVTPGTGVLTALAANANATGGFATIPVAGGSASVTVLHKDGTGTATLTAADTDAGRGTALLTAVTSPAATDTAVLGSGTFNTSTTIPSTTPFYRGQGFGATIISINQPLASLTAFIAKCFDLTITGNDGSIEQINGKWVPQSGTATEINAITLDAGEIATTSDTGEIRLGDGATAGGIRFIRTRTVEILVFAPGQTVVTGDNAAGFSFRVPAEFNGWNLVAVAAHVLTAGTTGNLDIQVRNATQTADMLTTAMRIETGETDTLTSAQPGTIDTGNDDVATGDKIMIDVDSVQSTPPAVLSVSLTFEG